MISFDESDLLDDESDDDGSDSGSAGTCAFTFFFEYTIGCVDDYVGCVCGMCSGVFVLIGIELIGVVVLLVVFILIGVESKGG